MAAAEAGHLPGLRPARPGTARTCSSGPTPSGASGWTPWASPGTAGWPRRGSAAAGREVRAASQENGLEGVVAKRLDSAVPPGRAQPRLAQGQELPHRSPSSSAAGGPGRAGGTGGIGSLLVGVPDDEGRLVYAGHVGTGFTDQDLRDLQRMLTAAEDVAVRRRAAARGHPRRALGRAGPGRRGGLRGVDGGRPAAAPVVARACATTWSPTTWWSSREPGQAAGGDRRADAGGVQPGEGAVPGGRRSPRRRSSTTTSGSRRCCCRTWPAGR